MADHADPIVENHCQSAFTPHESAAPGPDEAFQELAGVLAKPTGATANELEIELRSEDPLEAGPVNWDWFHLHRRVFRSLYSSGVLHAALLLLLACLCTRRGEQSGVHLDATAKATWQAGELTSPKDQPAQPFDLGGGHQDRSLESVDELVAAGTRDDVAASAPSPSPELAMFLDLYRPEAPRPRPTDLRARQDDSTDAKSDRPDLTTGGPQQVAPEARPASRGGWFFGVAALGRRFVFVVDCSWSMHGLRWERATRELLESVRSLQEDQSFYVIFFDAKAHCMFDSQRPEPDLAPASDENIRRLADWLPTLALSPQTEPAEAVRLAVGLKPDAVYLLSDGEFGGLTRAYLQQINLAAGSGPSVERPVVVHTIGLHSREGEAMLRRIAQDSGGTYRFVPDPTPNRDVFQQERLAQSDPKALFALLAWGTDLEADRSRRIIRAIYPGRDEGLKNLEGLANLEQLWLAGSKITDTGLVQVGRLDRLRCLVLSSCAISDDGLRHLRSLRELDGLFLDGTEVTDEGIRHLAELDQLEVFSAPEGLTDAGLKHLERLVRLTHLDLGGTQVTDRGLAHLVGLTRLTHLNLHAARVTGGGVQDLRRALPACEIAY